MTDATKNRPFRTIPSLDSLLREDPVRALIEEFGRLRSRLEKKFSPSLSPAVNATGIVMHSGLGRTESEVAQIVAGLVAEGSLITVAREKPEKFLHKTVYARLADGLVAGVRAYFDANPFRPTMPFSDVRAEFLKESDAPTLKLILDELIGKGVLYRKEAEVGIVGREAKVNPVEDQFKARIEGIFQSARFAAPLEDEVHSRLDLNLTLFKKILDGLIRDGRLVRLAPKVTYHRETLEAAREAVAGLIERRGSVTIAELRDRLNLSRKYAQAILEYFDKTGLTKRVEDRHVLAKP